MRRYGLAMVLFLFGLTAAAQGPATFEWKFKEGDKFYLETVSSVKASVEFLGMKLPSDTVNTRVDSFKVLKADGSTVVLEQKIELAKVKGAKLVGVEQALVEQMEGAVFKITLNRKGEVQKIEGVDDLVKKMSKDNEELGKVVKLLITEETFKAGAEEAFAFGPGKAIAKGESWKRKSTMPLKGIGAFLVETDYTYQGTGKDGEQVAVKQAFSYQPGKGDGGGVLPVKITKGDFKTEESKGVLVFDPATGRIVRQELRVKMKGTLTFTFADQEGMMQIEQDTDTKVRVMDKWKRDF